MHVFVATSQVSCDNMQWLSMLIDIPFYSAGFQNLTGSYDCPAFPPWNLFMDACEICKSMFWMNFTVMGVQFTLLTCVPLFNLSGNKEQCKYIFVVCFALKKCTFQMSPLIWGAFTVVLFTSSSLRPCLVGCLCPLLARCW